MAVRIESRACLLRERSGRWSSQAEIGGLFTNVIDMQRVKGSSGMKRVLWVVLIAFLLLPCSTAAGLPPYVRGKALYQWMVPRRHRDDGVYFTGANTRLRRAMAKVMSGQMAHITTVGGSNTAGDVRVDGMSWPQYFFNYMADHYGSNITSNNGAVGGTRSNYMATCNNMVVPRFVDMVLVEFALNDGKKPGPELKRAQERLVRKLLSYPNRPAVIIAHILPWNVPEEINENWPAGSEDSYHELALYYRIPTISVRACCFHLLAKGDTPGFNTTYRRDDHAGLKNISFYIDYAHVDGMTGARAVGELASHAMDLTAEDLKARAYNPVEEDVIAQEPLPPPLFPGNYESAVDRCFIGTHFKATVTEASNFEWINEAKGSRPRWGMVGREPGASFKMQFDSRAVTPSDQNVVVLVAYLKSYRMMGTAQIACVSGCSCQSALLEGHTDKRESQVDLLKMYITQAEECVMQVTVAQPTSSPDMGHKVKVTGLVVSEEGGESEVTLSGHQGAVDQVGTLSAKSHSGVYDVTNRD